MNDVARGAYNTNSQIKFKTTMVNSGLFDYSDAHILVKGTITIIRQGADTAAIALDKDNKKVIFKNCAPFTDEIRKINNTYVDNTKDFDVVMSMYNLIEYNNNYEKISGGVQ